jgi:DNA-binding LytR/AlgR family response regulator
MTAPMRERDQLDVRGHRAPVSGGSAKRSQDRQTASVDAMRLVVKTEGGVTLLPLIEIESLTADGNVVVVNSANGTYRLRESLASLAEGLKGFGFLRIHRGTIVRATAISSVEKGRYRKAFAVLRSGAKFEIGRLEFQRLRPLWQPGLLDVLGMSAGLQLVASGG